MANALIFFAEKKMLVAFEFEDTLAATIIELEVVINDVVKLTMLWTTGPRVEQTKFRNNGL